MNVLNLVSLGCFLISNRNFDIFKRDYNLQQSNQIDYLECNYVSEKTNIKIYSNRSFA